jgi:hypothetical protein
VIRVRGNALPTGEVVDLYADGDRWTTDPAPGAGLRPHDAAWSARSFRGLSGLTLGSPAGAVIYPADPRTDLSLLDKPSAVILRGLRVR